MLVAAVHSDLKQRFTYGQPLRVIGLGGGEEGLERVVGREDEAGNVDEELAGNVEEDEREVERSEAEDNVDLGHAGLLLELVQLRVLRQLPVEIYVSMGVLSFMSLASYFWVLLFLGGPRMQDLGRNDRVFTHLSSWERWY